MFFNIFCSFICYFSYQNVETTTSNLQKDTNMPFWQSKCFGKEFV